MKFTTAKRFMFYSKFWLQ